MTTTPALLPISTLKTNKFAYKIICSNQIKLLEANLVCGVNSFRHHRNGAYKSFYTLAKLV